MKKLRKKEILEFALKTDFENSLQHQQQNYYIICENVHFVIIIIYIYHTLYALLHYLKYLRDYIICIRISCYIMHYPSTHVNQIWLAAAYMSKNILCYGINYITASDYVINLILIIYYMIILH